MDGPFSADVSIVSALIAAYTVTILFVLIPYVLYQKIHKLLVNALLDMNYFVDCLQY